MRAVLRSPALLVLALAAVPVGAAANSAAFADAHADGSPDVTRVDMSNDDAGVLRLAISLPELATLPRDVSVTVGFDTDRDAATGGEGGADYLFRARDGSYRLLRWHGDRYAQDEYAEVTAAYRTALELTLPARAIGKPAAFDFFVLVERGGAFDRAPDAGAYSYEVKIAPRATRLHARFTPEPPRAGRAFTASGARLYLSDGTVVAAADVRCAARLGRRLLRGRGPGRCTWDVPRRAAGERLVVRLTVTYAGRRIPFAAWTFRVRS